MAQTPPPTGKTPVAKPAGNPYANIQAAPRAAPKVNLVRPTGPVAAPPKPMSGSPSSMGLNPSYTSSNPVNANDRGGDRIQKMPREMMFDPQIQYNLLTKPLAAKYGLEGPASLLNPENYSYNNLQDGISKFGNTLGNVTNLMAYGTPVGAAFAGAGQAANTAGALGNTTPGNALAGAGGAAMVTFAVKNILGRGSAAGMAGQTILELTKLAGSFGKSEIVNAVKNLTGADISGYIDTAFNADILTGQIPSLGIQKPSAVSNWTGDNQYARSAIANYFQELIEKYYSDEIKVGYKGQYSPESLERRLREEKDFALARAAGKIGEDPRLTGDTEYFKERSEIKVYSPEELDAQSRASKKFNEWLSSSERQILESVQREFRQPIAINLPSENAAKVLVDGFFKNLHYPGVRSRGSHDPVGRRIYEEAVLDIPKPGASGLDPSQHPIYGYAMFPGGSDDRNAYTYGNTTFVLKDAIKDRSSVTFGDTGGMGREVQPVEHGSTDIRKLRPAIGRKSQSMRSYNWSNPFDYTEAQIMGGVTLDDIAKIIYKPKEDMYDPGDVELRKLLAQLQIPYQISPRERRW